MFIPDNKLSTGDYVQLKQDYRISGGTFTSGHIFRIKHYHRADDLYDIEDDDGLKITNIKNIFFQPV